MTIGIYGSRITCAGIDHAVEKRFRVDYFSVAEILYDSGSYLLSDYVVSTWNVRHLASTGLMTSLASVTSTKVL